MTLTDVQLLEAATRGELKLIKALLKKNANIQAKDESGRSPLHLAAESNHLEVVKFLCECKADLNAQDNSEGAPLFDAVAMGHDKVVSFLINIGADCNLTDEHDLSLLHTAVFADNLSTAKLLIQHHPSLVKKAKFNGVTPLHIAKSEAMGRLLLNHGAEVNALIVEEITTPLMDAVERGNLDLVKLLVRRGANILILGCQQESAIDIAKKNKRHDIAEYLEKKIYDRAVKTQAKFFNYKRSKSAITKSLSDYYRLFRTQEKHVGFYANDVPARRLVTADVSLLAGVDKKSLASPEKIASTMQWYNGGLLKPSGKIDSNWGRESIHYLLDVDPGSKTKKNETLLISSQYHPSSSHLGNFFMAGIGKYGEHESKNILRVINATTQTRLGNRKQIENEKVLAKLILEYTQKGQPITTEALKKAGLELFLHKKDRVQQLAYLNRICYLTVVKEVSRRMNTGIYFSGQPIEDLPISIAFLMSLQLIAQGHLTMQQVFNQNADFGLPTASQISTEREVSIAKSKFIKLATLFYAHNPQETVNREGFHHVLKGYGAISDTSDNEYLSSDKSETENEFCISKSLSLLAI